MTTKNLWKNQELGRLVQFAFDLHVRGKKSGEYNVPIMQFYDTWWEYGRKYNDSLVYEHISYSGDDKIFADIELLVMTNFNSDKQRYENIYHLYTITKDYHPSFWLLKQISETSLDNYDYDGELNKKDYEELYIDCFEALGFKREDVMAVINGEMTAREAYQHIAIEEYKNRQWICKEGKFYEFDENITIPCYLSEFFSESNMGSYGWRDTDSFPWPKFNGHPVIDCSIFNARRIKIGNKTRIELINVNSNPDSIEGANLKNAIIREPIDLAKVKTRDTIFGEHILINMDKSLDNVEEKNIRFVYNEAKEEMPKNRVKLLSNASNVEMVSDGVVNGTEGIGLVREEILIESDPKVVKSIATWINDGEVYHEYEVLDDIETMIYNDAKAMYAASLDKDITFRLTDIHPYVLANIVNFTYYEIKEPYERGAWALCELYEILEDEARAIIRAAKEAGKTANILVPYVENINDIRSINKYIMEVAKEEQYDDIKIGAMIESIPGALSADEIADEVDFVSIGTNDLTESVLKCERSDKDPRFSILTDEVKEYINLIVNRVKRTKDIPINICGALPNNEKNLEYFLSLNIDSITINPGLIDLYRSMLNEYYDLRESNNKEMTFKLS